MFNYTGKVEEDKYNGPGDEKSDKVLFKEDSGNLVFKDNNMTIYPVEFLNNNKKSCFSYICIPK